MAFGASSSRRGGFGTSLTASRCCCRGKLGQPVQQVSDAGDMPHSSSACHHPADIKLRGDFAKQGMTIGTDREDHGRQGHGVEICVHADGRPQSRPTFSRPPERRHPIRVPQLHPARLRDRQSLLRPPRDRLAPCCATSAIIPTARLLASGITDARKPHPTFSQRGQEGGVAETVGEWA